MKKLIESQIPDDLAELVAFASFNTDPPEHHELCKQHRLVSLPCLEYYRDGSLVRTTIGLLTAAVITQYLRELIEDAG